MAFSESGGAPTCSNCHQKGHVVADCPNKKGVETDAKTRKERYAEVLDKGDKVAVDGEEYTFSHFDNKFSPRYIYTEGDGPIIKISEVENGEVDFSFQGEGKGEAGEDEGLDQSDYVDLIKGLDR